MIDKAFIKKLESSLNYSRRLLTPFRERRVEALKAYVGSNYSDNGSIQKEPINLLASTFRTYTRLLAAGDPKASVYAANPELKFAAKLLQLGLDNIIEKIGLGDTSRKAVMDSMFSLGIVKVALEPSMPEGEMGYKHRSSMPFADNVDLDNWVHDMTARRFEECAYMGDRYRIPLKDAQNDERFDKEMRKKLNATPYLPTDIYGVEKVEAISRYPNFSMREPELHEVVSLWDIWLPREGRLITIDEHFKLERPLRDVKWTGPDGGPYHLLYYETAPNNTMPIAPYMNIISLHEIANQLYQKLKDQAKRQKTLLGVQAGSDEDANRIAQSSDGEIIRMDNPNAAKEVSFGGIDQRNYVFVQDVMKQFNFMAGNPELLSGTAAQSQTLGQDELLKASGSQMVGTMQDAVFRFMEGIIKDLAYYLFTDPAVKMPLTLKPTDGLEIPAELNSESMKGEYMEYQFTIEPYSMTHNSPQMKMTKLQSLMNLFAPMLPMMQQQGIGFKFNKILEFYSEYANLPEVKDIFDMMTPYSGSDALKPEYRSTKPAQTNRTYTRVNVSPGRQEPMTMNEMPADNSGRMQMPA